MLSSFRSATAIVASIFALSAFTAPVSMAAPLDEAQIACATGIDKSWAKSIKAVEKELSSCLKDIAKGTTSAGSCLGRDRKGKVAKVRDKMLATDRALCAGASRPGFGYAGVAATFVASEAVDDALIPALFGDDPAAALPTGAPDAAAASCQQAVAKALAKCVDTQAKEYVKCRKGALAGGAEDAAALAACFTADAKGKVAKACDLDADGKVDKLRGTIAKKCAGVTLATAFPTCNPADAEELHACLLAPARCATCRATAEASELETALDCDDYDNAGPDGSCVLVFPEHVVIANDVEPAETPGSPGVVVTNPSLLTQFGGGSFSLNNS